MLVWDFFKKYLFSRRAGALIKGISWISIVSVFLGVTALIMVTSIMNGFNETIRKRMFGIEPHVVIVSEKLGEEGEFQLNEGQKVFENAQGVAETSFVTKTDVILRTFEGLFGGGIAKGYSRQELNQLFQRVHELNQKKQGVQMPAPEIELGPNEVIMGVDLARSLEVFEGDEILLIPPETLLLPPGESGNYQRVKVASIVYTRLADVDSKLLFYDRQLGLPFLNSSPSKKSQLELRLHDPYRVDSFVGLHKVTLGNFKVSTWKSRNEALFFALKLEKISMTTFLGLAVLITGFSIVSALVLLISQKKSDYGILLAMGLSMSQGQKLFSRLGFILASLGIVSGTLVGVALALYLQFFPPDILPAIYYDSTIPARVDSVTVVVIVGVALFFAWLGTRLPVRSLLKLTPTEALRK